MATTPAPSPADSTSTPTAVCVHCGAPIRQCAGESALPKWGRALPDGRCVFDGFVHTDGRRLGSHLCGKGGHTAAPADPGGWTR